MDQKTKKKLEEIIRVNHAGELGAQNIYNSQIKFCRDNKLKKKLEKISQEEKVHYDFFEDQILKKELDQQLCLQLGKLEVFFLGAITSRLGLNYVHACTEAVEEVIVKHYENQIKYLEKKKRIDENLKKKIIEFCKDEDKHRKNADQSIRNDDFRLRLFKSVTRNITKLAIKISKKV